MNCRKLKFTEDVMCLTADSREDLIISGYEEGYVTVWDPRCEDSAAAIISGRCQDENVQQYEDVCSLSFGHKNTEEVHIASGRCVYRLDLRKVEVASWTKPVFSVNEDVINQISLSDNDEMLAAADDSHIITVIDLRHSRLLARLKKHQNFAYSVQFRPGKPRELISGGYDCSLVHWDVLKCRALNVFDLGDFVDPNWEMPKSFNPSYVLCCRFASIMGDECNKADIVTAGTENGNLHCFHCDKNLIHFRTFRAHDLGVTQVTFGTDDQNVGVIYTGSNDERIKLWETAKLFADYELQPQRPEVRRVIEYGQKINWLCLFQNKQLIVCDTTANIGLLPVYV